MFCIQTISFLDNWSILFVKVVIVRKKKAGVRSMKGKKSKPFDLAGRLRILSPMVVAAIAIILVISIYAVQPAVIERSAYAAPRPTPSPRKKTFKPQSPESNGRSVGTNSASGRTETVDNNETLRRNLRSNNGNAAGTAPSTNRSSPAAAGAPRGLLPYLEQSNILSQPRNNNTSTTAGAPTGGSTKKKIKRKARPKK